MTAEVFLFFLVSALAVGSALAVVLQPNPVYCALALVVALFQVAAVFVLLGAHTLAFLQIIVYAGAIMVLFLFVIMMLNLQHDREPPSRSRRVVTMGAGSLLAAELAAFFLGRPGLPAAEGALADDFGSVTALGRSLFTDHVLAFELTSLLLLVAIVGAVVVARKGS